MGGDREGELYSVLKPPGFAGSMAGPGGHS